MDSSPVVVIRAVVVGVVQVVEKPDTTEPQAMTTIMAVQMLMTMTLVRFSCGTLLEVVTSKRNKRGTEIDSERESEKK